MKLLAIALSAFMTLGIAACPRQVPDPPEHWKCQYNKPDGGSYAFYCVNSKTQAHLKIPVTAPKMKGAQCLSPNDFKSVMAWGDQLIKLASERCQ